MIITTALWFRPSEPCSRNAMKLKLSAKEAQGLRCFEERLRGCKVRVPALATMAMGDANAVELGQGAHVLLGLQAGAFKPEELLLIHGRVPCAPLAAGIIVDDFIVIEKVLRASVAFADVGSGHLPRASLGWRR